MDMLITCVRIYIYTWDMGQHRLAPESTIAPVLTQEDLVAGCKLQMRGSLTEKYFEAKIAPLSGLGKADAAYICR
jgi:hypothetical protein